MSRWLRSPREPIALPPDAEVVYRRALHALAERGVPVLVGGGWAMTRLAGVRRYTKDLDLFVRPADVLEVLATLDAVGFRTELLDTVWLAKAWWGDLFIDLIFGSGNGIAVVDDVWFTHALPGEVFDVPVRFCPVEEIIWSKAWIMERERWDGADIAHLLRAAITRLDWHRLLDRFGEHWRVLYVHLLLFGYVYPGERGRIPAWVMRDLGQRLAADNAAPPATARVCRGPLLSRQFRSDIERWGYTAPPRVEPALGSENADVDSLGAARRRG